MMNDSRRKSMREFYIHNKYRDNRNRNQNIIISYSKSLFLYLHFYLFLTER